MYVVLKAMYRPVVTRAARQIMMGRLVNRNAQEHGRFTRSDIDDFLTGIWVRLDEVMASVPRKPLPTLGARHNTFLSALTVSAFQVLLESGISRDYAMELAADVGWKIYVRLLWFPRLISRIATRDPQKRINLVLWIFMRFPFRGTSRPGYEVTAWAEPDRYCTDWTYCPPLAFVREYIDKKGDRGELEAFRKSWCGYDWALPAAILDGDSESLGHYERPHTMSHGDPICDMRWYGRHPHKNPHSKSNLTP